MNNTTNNDTTPTRSDELSEVPTDVLAAWVTDRGRCVWEATFGQAPEWTGTVNDREIAARVCAGCPLRAECLELEARTAEYGDDWSAAIHPTDRNVLRDMWSQRCRADIEAIEATGAERGDA